VRGGRWIICTLGLPCALALACGGEPAGESPEAAAPPAQEASAPEPAAAPAGGGGPSEAAVEEARQIFASRCVTCHGPEGRGDGPGSAALSPPPRNFQDAEWQRSVTDDHIEMIIQYGGAAVGRSPTMPANPDLTSKPEVVRALREHVRSLGQSG
jgi:mono/diheme cytochrome c family protein